MRASCWSLRRGLSGWPARAVCSFAEAAPWRALRNPTAEPRPKSGAAADAGAERVRAAPLAIGGVKMHYTKLAGARVGQRVHKNARVHVLAI